MQAGNACSANSLTQHPQVCHSEERSDVGISRSGLRFRRGLYVIRPCTARLPRRFAPRNDTSGSAAVHQRPPAVEWLCTRRSVTALQAGNACSANSLTQHPQVCHSEERSDVGISRSGLRFRRGLYVIRPCTARLPRRFAPRNDTSGWCRGAPAPLRG